MPWVPSLPSHGNRAALRATGPGSSSVPTVPPETTWVQAVRANTPTAWLRFADTSGATALDTTANANNGTFVNTPTLAVAGAASLEDKAVSLNGTDQRVSLPAGVTALLNTASTPKSFCILLVAAIDATVVAGKYLFSGGDSVDTDPIIGVATDALGLTTVYRNDAGTIVNPLTAATLGTYADGVQRLYALESDGTTLTTYVSGVAVASGAIPTGATTITRFNIGELGRNTESAFCKEVVDEFAIYPAALGATQHAALQTAFASGAFQVSEGSGATARAIKGDGSDVSHPEGHPDMWNGNAVVLTAGQETAIHDLLYNATTGLGLTRYRDNEPTTGTLPGITAANTFEVENPNDDGDPNNYNAAGFNFTGPRSNDLARYGVKAKAAGALKGWWGPIARESWMTVPTSATPNATDVAERAEWLLAIIRSRAAQGAPLDFFHVGNEPDYTTSPMSGQFIRDVIKNVCPRLAAEGLTTRVVLGPFNKSSTAAAIIDIVMADATARGYVVALGIHGYDEASTNIAAMKYRAEKWNIPLWEAELSKTTVSTMVDQTNSDIGWAKAAQDILTLYNCTALDFMMGAYGSQETNSLVVLSYAGAVFSGSAIRAPLGYYFMQFSKYIRPGMQRVRVTSSDANVKVSAWRNPTSGQVVIVAVNGTAGALTPTITCSRLTGKTTAAVTRSSATDSNAAQSAQAIAANAFAPVLPAASVETFVA